MYRDIEILRPSYYWYYYYYSPNPRRDLDSYCCICVVYYISYYVCVCACLRVICSNNIIEINNYYLYLYIYIFMRHVYIIYNKNTIGNGRWLGKRIRRWNYNENTFGNTWTDPLADPANNPYLILYIYNRSLQQ